jgi:hypothetical protein
MIAATSDSTSHEVLSTARTQTTYPGNEQKLPSLHEMQVSPATGQSAAVAQ